MVLVLGLGLGLDVLGTSFKSANTATLQPGTMHLG